MESFMKVYIECLEAAVTEYPQEYRFPVEHVQEVAALMQKAIEKSTYSNTGRAFKATCKKLGIKNTYKAISNYLHNHQ